MIGYLSEFGLGDISYLEWMKYTYPMLLIEIPIAVTVTNPKVMFIVLFPVILIIASASLLSKP